MKRKLFGAASVGIAAVMLAASAPAPASAGEVVDFKCGPTVQACVDGVIGEVEETWIYVCERIWARDCG